MATTASYLVQGGLLNINSYSPGAPLETQDANTGLDTLNDLLESLSNDKAFIFTQDETIFQWIGGQYEYTVGNPVSPTTFSGTITGGSPIISGVTQIPADLAV